jgi:sugar phosphate isomerase/epimerase
MRLTAALCPAAGPFAPLLFAGRLEEGLRVVAELGYDAVELSLRSADEVDASWLEERLAAGGLVVSTISVGRMYYEEGISISAPAADKRRACGERVAGLVRLASRLGSAVTIGGVRGVLPRDNEGPQLRAAAGQLLRTIAADAAVLGVPLLVEPINRYETNFLNTAAETVEFLAEYEIGNAGLLLDTFHMNIEEVSLPAALRLAGADLAYVHLADSNRWAPGCGHTDLQAVVATLQDLGFAGYIGMEILPRPDDREAARVGLENTRRLVEESR